MLQRCMFLFIALSYLSWLLVCSDCAAATGFQALGVGTVPYEVSGNGSSVVGRAANGHAAVWQASSGWGDLGFTGYAYDASYDGAVVVGWTGQSQSTLAGNRAFRWTAGTGAVNLPFANSGDGGSQALSISADGSTIVGAEELPGSYRFAIRWSEATGTIDMRSAPGMPTGPYGAGAGVEASGVSGDGSTIVGHTINAISYPWIWSRSNNTVTPLPNTLTTVRAVSADGNAVVGIGVAGTSGAALWTPQFGLQMLHVGNNADARDVTGDGSMVTGLYVSNGSQTAFVWDSLHGFRKLQDMLVNDYHLDLAGWQRLNWAYVADNGRTFAGIGFDANGQFGGWVATVPEPTALVFLATGAIALVAYAWRRLASRMFNKRPRNRPWCGCVS
jgi:hypothetical protein